MVKLITSIVAASALVISASAIDGQVAQDSASGASLYEEEASLEASIAFMPEEEFASAAWEVEPASEEEESGLSLMAQLSNYIQNLLHPTSEEEEVEEEEEIEEAQDMDANEVSQQSNVKRTVGSARHRRQLNKRADGHQDDKGYWHYSVPKHKPEQTPAPKQDEASLAPPELEQLDIAQDVPEQDMQKSVEMEGFPFFPPNLDPFFWGSLLPDKIKQKIASKVKEKADEVSKAFGSSKEKSDLKTPEPSTPAATPTPST